jgi:3-keto-5-aminohexanoate cleavage enzyme
MLTLLKGPYKTNLEEYNMLKTLPKDKILITVAMTGALVTKEQHPDLPVTPDEIAENARLCVEEGAAICHIHGKDKNGGNTSDVAVFREIKEKVRAKSDAIIQFSTGGGPNLTQEQRIECLDALPEMASLNMGSLMRLSGQYKGTAFCNLPDEIETYLAKMKRLNIKPEMEVYNVAMFKEVNDIIKKGLVEPPYCINLVLGMRYQGALEATPKILTTMIDFLPDNSVFNCAAVGSDQLPITTLNMLLGGAVRIGLEDNIFYSKGVKATNMSLVARTVRIARELGKEPMTPAEAREFIGLKPL